jgi:hypothetical protein
MQGAFQRSRREETLGDGEAAQVVESERHAELTEYRLLPRRGGRHYNYNYNYSIAAVDREST